MLLRLVYHFKWEMVEGLTGTCVRIVRDMDFTGLKRSDCTGVNVEGHW